MLVATLQQQDGHTHNKLTHIMLSGLEQNQTQAHMFDSTERLAPPLITQGLD